MTLLRSILTLSALLLTSNGITLVGSQSQPASLFYERQTNVTTLSGQVPAVTTTATATLSAIAHTQADTHTSDSSTSSATTTYARATNSGIDMSDTEMQQIQAYRAQQENVQEQEMKIRVDETAYNDIWLCKLGPKQEKLAKEITTVLPDLPKELIHLIAQYQYEFKGICKEIRNKKGNISQLIGLPDNSIVALAGNNGEICTIEIWSATTDSKKQIIWNCTQKLNEDTNHFTALVALINGSFASGTREKTVSIWSPSAGPQEQRTWNRIQTFEKHNNEVSALAALSNGSLASGSLDRTIKFWSPSTDSKGQTTWNFAHELNEQGPVQVLAELPNGSVVSGTMDLSISVWSASTNTEGQTTWKRTPIFAGNPIEYIPCLELAIFSDGSFASTCNSTQITVWSPDTDSEGQTTWHNQKIETDNFRGLLAVLPDGSLAHISIEGRVSLWLPTTAININKQSNWLFSLLFSLVTKAKTQRTWECDNRRLETYCSVHHASVLPNGSLIVGSLIDGTIKIWN